MNKFSLGTLVTKRWTRFVEQDVQINHCLMFVLKFMFEG